MSTSIDFDAAWGGYYARQSPESGVYSVFRLLDFGPRAYQAALFAEKFDALPPREAVLALRPFVGHAPIDARALVREGEPTLVAHAPLTRADLEGYLYFLELQGMPDAKRSALAQTLVAYSQEAPLALRLELTADGGLSVTERK